METPRRATLSVAIVTLNEEANLPRTLASVAWADEVIVVDSGSTDATRAVANTWVGRLPLMVVSLDENEGAVGNALLRVELNKKEHEIAQFEWIEDGKPYREWLIPSCLINELGKTVIAEIRD